MSFWKNVMSDAAPKADKLKSITCKVGDKLAHNTVVDAAGKVGYKALVNTVGITAVIAAPAASKISDKWNDLKSWANESTSAKK
jgi:hypothetical protein